MLATFSKARGRALATNVLSLLRFSTTAPELPPFAYTPPAYTGPSKESVRALRHEFMNPAIFHFYKDPVLITAGKQQYLYDETGRRYLDAFAGIVTVRVSDRRALAPRPSLTHACHAVRARSFAR